MAKTRDPFELNLSPEQRDEVTRLICTEVQAGIDARATQEGEVDYWHQLYEQARTRTKNQPWPDAADLTSYLPSEKVDALAARIVKTVFVDPIWTVEGYGDAAPKAPFVEEFHQWKAEEERIQSIIYKLVLISLIEPRGLLEVSEGSEMRTVRKRITAKVETDPATGGFVYDDKGSPKLVRDEQGTIVPAGDQDAAAETVVDSTERVRTGPVYRILPYRDSVILPGHARDKDEIWGYGKRFWRRLSDIKRKAERGVYDKDVVEKMSTVGDKEADPPLQRANQDVAPEQEATTQKELWEVLVLLDLNLLFTSKSVEPLRGSKFNSERWFLATVHLPSQQMLRFQHDDMERSRFVPVILLPRTDRATEGFSFIGHKLITTAEEHTAWRNMAADRAAMVLQSPIKRLQGGLWDPVEQPWGPKAVIDVRDMREIEPVVIPDLTAPALEHIQMMERTAERLSGINDIASGQVSQESRTLGEVQMATENSAVRMDLIVRQFQESMEDLGQIRHAIWKRCLAEYPNGQDASPSLLSGMEGRGVSIDEFMPDKKVTAQLLEGAFRFKPNGSVETADPARRRQDFNMALQVLPVMQQTFPKLVPLLQTQQAARAMFREFLRTYRIPNAQAFIGSPSADLMSMQQQEPIAIPGAPPDPAVAAKIQAENRLQIAQLHEQAETERHREDNETRLAVAELGAKVDRIGLFLEERARLGAQAHEIGMAGMSHVGDAQQAALSHQQTLQQGQQDHQQALQQAQQGHEHALEQGQQAADLAPEPATPAA